MKCAMYEINSEATLSDLRELGPLLTPDYPSGEGVSGPVATVASWPLPASWAAIA